MVRGLERFREYFQDFLDNYVIIGGTACDILISGEGFVPRATKDIDIILVVEQLTNDFVKQLWKFLKDGGYQSLQEEPQERKYYRFTQPTQDDFPFQIELFSRKPDALESDEKIRFTRIAVDEEVSSLSAIMMDDNYYNYTIRHSSAVDGLHRADLEALICLKARAFLDLVDRKAQGETIDEKDIKKHKHDVFRLAAMLAASARFVLPGAMRSDMLAFADRTRHNLPDNVILRVMKAPNLEMDALYEQLCENFGIGNEGMLS